MKIKIYKSILLIFILLAVSSTFFGQWTQLTDMRTARNAYAVGTGKTGDVKGMVTNSIYTFDFGFFQYNTEGYILK